MFLSVGHGIHHIPPHVEVFCCCWRCDRAGIVYSLHMWGCFLLGVSEQVVLSIFPTHVGVFLPMLVLL